MPTTIQGFEVITQPASTTIESFPIFITVPASAPGVLRVVTFPTEFNAIAISIQMENQDSANSASYRINSDIQTMVNLPASNFRSLNNMNIVSVTIDSGAAGPTIITGQMAALPKPINLGFL